MCAVPNMAVFCSSLISCFPGMLLRYCLSDFEIIIIIIIIIITIIILDVGHHSLVYKHKTPQSFFLSAGESKEIFQLSCARYTELMSTSGASLRAEGNNRSLSSVNVHLQANKEHS